MLENKRHDAMQMLGHILNECGCRYNAEQFVKLVEYDDQRYLCYFLFLKVGDEDVSEKMNDPYTKRRIVELIQVITEKNIEGIYFTCGY